MNKLDALDRIQETARTTGAQTIETIETIRPYSTRSWGEIARLNLPPPVWFWGECFALGLDRVRLHAIFGQGGLGKSRIGMNIGFNQVLGLPFGNMPTGNKPLRHLYMGTENGLHRLQYDIRRMSNGLLQAEQEKIDAHIFLSTLEAPDDPYVILADPANADRWRATIEYRQPDVLWVDPWGDVQSGDANADTDTRWTLTELTKILGSVNRNSAIVILAHARTGVRNIMEAVGYDGANFGKGSKALYSCARCVFNLAPGSEDENPPIIVACSKSNDGSKPRPFALTMSPDSMTYEVDPTFDVDSWLADIRDRAKGKLKANTKAQNGKADMLSRVPLDKPISKDALIGSAQGAGIGEKKARRLINELVEEGSLHVWRIPRPKTNPRIGLARFSQSDS